MKNGTELLAPSKALLVAVDGIPFNAHHEAFRFLHAPRYLEALTVGVSIKDAACPPIGGFELLAPVQGHRVSDVFHHHRLVPAFAR